MAVHLAPAPETARRGPTTRAGPLSFLILDRDRKDLAPPRKLGAGARGLAAATPSAAARCFLSAS